MVLTARVCLDWKHPERRNHNKRCLAIDRKGQKLSEKALFLSVMLSWLPSFKKIRETNDYEAILEVKPAHTLSILLTLRAFGRCFYPKRPATVQTHSNTDGGVNHARRQPAHRKQLGYTNVLRKKVCNGSNQTCVVDRPL